jgi:hypothetical protein
MSVTSRERPRPEPEIYVVWQDPDGTLLFTQQSRDVFAEGLAERGAVAIYAIRAASWDWAVQFHYDIQDWRRHPITRTQFVRC